MRPTASGTSPVLAMLIAAALGIAATGCNRPPPPPPEVADRGHGEGGPVPGHSGGDEPDEHSDVVRLTAEQLAEAGVVIAPLGGGTIVSGVALPGEIAFNADAVTHITPRVPGIAARVEAYLGDEVKAGQILAVLESSELGQAKIEYLTALAVQEQARADLARQGTISASTESLLALLKAEPSLEELQSKAAGLRVGENKGKLITAYAKLITGRANHERELSLREQGLSTEVEALAAREAFNSGQAEYFAAVEDISFHYQAQLTQAERAHRVAESSLGNAERRLHLLGLSDQKVRSIQTEPDTEISRYELSAPTAGRIVSKHITVGEKIDGQEPVFTIADLSTVWLNISVYAKYLGAVQEHQPVTVTAGNRTAEGEITYLGSTVSESTRTVIARVVLQNGQRQWLPGQFITVQIETGRETVARAVPVGAVQTFAGRPVVFVQDEEGIEPRPIRPGRRDDQTVELLDGPPLGTPIVVKNSFLIKAELGKSAAGHEH